MTIRWGILGCGDIARKRVARAILDEPRSRLFAACRRDAEKLRDFCQSFGVERGYARDADLLAIAAQTRVGQQPPNLLLAAVHYLLLRGSEHPLAAFYPSLTAAPDQGDDLLHQ